MAQVIYEHDYHEEYLSRFFNDMKNGEIDESIFDLETRDEGSVYRFSSVLDNMIPKRVNSKRMAAYDRILEKADAIAKFRGGKVCGVMGKSSFESKIILTIRFLWFESEELALLRDIAENARSVIFTHAEDRRYMNMTVYLDCYQDDLENVDIHDLMQLADKAALEAGIKIDYKDSENKAVKIVLYYLNKINEQQKKQN